MSLWLIPLFWAQYTPPPLGERVLARDCESRARCLFQGGGGEMLDGMERCAKERGMENLRRCTTPAPGPANSAGSGLG